MNRLFASLCASALIASVAPIFAQVSPAPPLMNFQGRLAKPDGTPVADGTYSVRFSFWDALSAGTEKWTQTVDPVTVRNGVFSTLLSVDTPGLFARDLWLEIKIGANDALTPRQRFVSVAYAMKAGTVADGSITSASIAEGAITASKLDANIFTNGNVWSLTGNAGLDAALNFLGTTDAQSLAFRTNNVERMRLLPNGNLGVGTANPNGRLHVTGGPGWTSNGWLKSLTLDNASAIEFGQGINGTKWGLGATGTNLYLFSTPTDAVDSPATYRMTFANNGNVGIATTTPGYAFTVKTAGGFGMVHTNGTVDVGSYVSSAAGWYGTVSNHPFYLYSNNSGARLTVATNGYIGIGTTNPGRALEVVGGVYSSNGGGNGLEGHTALAFNAGVFGVADNASAWGVTGKHTATGNIGYLGLSSTGVYGVGATGGSTGGYFTNTAGGLALLVNGTAQIKTLQLTGADVAEKFDMTDKVKPGMVVEIDPNRGGQLRLAQKAYSRLVAGVVSGAGKLAAGIVLTAPKSARNAQPIALSGRVWVWCDSTKRAIFPGDLMTTSSRAGFAMAATSRTRAQGATLGKAMTSLPKGKTGLVLVLVNLQ